MVFMSSIESLAAVISMPKVIFLIFQFRMRITKFDFIV